MFGSGCPREGREEGELKEGERWPGPPNIFDRSPPLLIIIIKSNDEHFILCLWFYLYDLMPARQDYVVSTIL